MGIGAKAASGKRYQIQGLHRTSEVPLLTCFGSGGERKYSIEKPDDYFDDFDDYFDDSEGAIKHINQQPRK